jgi:hypothetical protein
MDQILQVEWDLTDEDLKTYQREISKTNDVRYVFYDPESGIVKSIAFSYENQTDPYVTVPFLQVADILDGKEFYYNFKVVFSPDEKDFVLIKKEEEQEILESIHDVIFQIPFSIDTTYPLIYDSMNDLTFVQDYADTCWKIYINGKLADSLREKRLYFDKYYSIYVTARNDPNLLYKTIEIPFKELVENYYYILPFDKIDTDEVPVSLFCKKMFTKYQYIKTKI